MSYAQVGRVATAAVLATAGAALVLGLLTRRRPPPVPLVRCPIHGIAYDTDLEICPECAKTPAATGPAGPETHHLETETTTGGPR
jgi:hypothetical protein